MVTGIMGFLKIVLAISVVGKAYLHAHVAYRNNIKLGSGGGLPVKTLWYFTKPVGEEYEKLKEICNVLQSINIILFLFLIVLSIFL